MVKKFIEKISKCIFVLLGSSFFLVSFTFAQEASQVSFRYDLSKGLPERVIYSLCYSSDNFLYLGTESGLYRFNGSLFTLLPIKDNLSNALTDVQEGPNKVIYARNFNNQLYHLINDTLELVDTIFKSNTIQGGATGFRFFKDEIFFRKDLKYFVYNIYNKKKRFIDPNLNTDIKSHFHISDFIVDSSGIIEYNNETGIFFSGSKKRLPYLGNGAPGIAFYKNRYIFYSKNITTPFLYAYLENDSLHFQSLNIGDKSIVYHITQNQDRLFLCTNNGLYTFDPFNQMAELVALPKEQVTDVKSDNEGNYWVSTLRNGLFYIPKNSPKEIFTIPQSYQEEFYSLSYGFNDLLIFGTSTGRVLYIDRASGYIMNELMNTYRRGNTFLNYNKKFNILASSYGFYTSEKWFTPTDGLFYQVSSDFLDSNYFVSSSFGVFWGNVNNLKQHNYENSFNVFIEGFKNIIYKRSRTINADTINKIVYLGLNDGLQVFNPKTETLEPVLNLDGSQVVASDCFFDYTIGALVVGTFKDGILFVKNGKVVKQVTQFGNHVGDAVSKVRKGPNGVFIFTKSGVDFYEYNGSITPFSKQLGFFEYIISDLLYIEDDIYLATGNKVLKAEWPISKRNAKLNLKIKSIVIGNTLFEYKNLQNLAAPKADVLVHFEGNHFSSFGQWVYQYRIVNNNQNNWINLPSTASSLALMGLSHGTHVVELRMILANEGISSTISTIQFKLLPPWYLTWYFYLFVFLLVSIILYLIYRWRILLLEKKQTEKLQLQKLQLALSQSQLATLRSQMNPHFMYNVLNSLQSYIFSGKTMEASNFLGMFSDLMRKVLNNSIKSEISLKEEIDTLQLYLKLEALRFEDDFTYTFEIDEELELDEVFIPSMLIQPYIENAFKHGLLHKKGGNKRLEVILKQINQTLNVRVIDNGIGREESARINARKRFKPASFATEAIADRIVLLNKSRLKPITTQIIDLTDEQGRSLGTEVIIAIPILND